MFTMEEFNLLLKAIADLYEADHRKIDETEQVLAMPLSKDVDLITARQGQLDQIKFYQDRRIQLNNLYLKVSKMKAS